MIRALLLLTGLLAGVDASAESYEERWERIANEHLALVKNEPGKSYEHELIAVHNTFWKDVTRACRRSAKKAKADDFYAVAVIAADGRIDEFLTMPREGALACYERQMVGRHYPKPPTVPFYELIHVTLRAPR